MYAGYKLKHRFAHRRRHWFTVLIIVLLVVTIASITALFWRGFRLDDIPKQFTQQSLTTPAMQVWLIEFDNYDDKMTAYKAGVAASNEGLGIYVLPSSGKWTWVASVYQTEEFANDALQKIKIPNATVKCYEIEERKISVPSEAKETGNQIITAIQNIFNLLLKLREAISQSQNTNNIILALTEQYNQIKEHTETLQNINQSLQDEFLATIIYSANQNILSLQKIVQGNNSFSCSLAEVNTALLKTIFSLDNF